MVSKLEYTACPGTVVPGQQSARTFESNLAFLSVWKLMSVNRSVPKPSVFIGQFCHQPQRQLKTHAVRGCLGPSWAFINKSCWIPSALAWMLLKWDLVNIPPIRGILVLSNTALLNHLHNLESQHGLSQDSVQSHL